MFLMKLPYELVNIGEVKVSVKENIYLIFIFMHWLGNYGLCPSQI